MSDIVARLRDLARVDQGAPNCDGPLCLTAADQFERMRAALRQIETLDRSQVSMDGYWVHNYFGRIAAKALEPDNQQLGEGK